MPEVDLAGSIYLSHADNVLFGAPVGQQSYRDYLRSIIMNYALFFKHLVIGDAPFLNNPILADIFTGETYRAYSYAELLKHGVIVLALRREMKDFQHLDQHMKARGMLRSHEKHQEKFAQFIDDCEPAIHRFDGTPLQAAYHEAIMTCLNSEAFYRLARVVDRRERMMKEVDDSLRFREALAVNRSMMFGVSERLLDEDHYASMIIRSFSSVAYHGNISNHLGICVEYPPEFSRMSWILGEVQDGMAGKRLALEDPAKSFSNLDWRTFNRCFLYVIDAEFVLTARRDASFLEYAEALRSVLSNPNSGAARSRFGHALLDYQGYLSKLLVDPFLRGMELTGI